jgi:hypothetical protein
MSEVSEGSGPVSAGDSSASSSSSPEPGSAASIRPIPGQPPRSASQASRESEPQGDESSPEGGEPQSPGQKQESRYERTKREKAEFKAAQQQFKREQEMFARERAQFEEAKKPKRNYTLAQLKQYREEWAKEAELGYEGREDLVAKADQAIAEMEAEEKASKKTMELPVFGTPEHKRIWEESEAQIRAEDPEFGVQGTRIDTELRKLFNGPNAKLYLDHPYGIYAAYSEATKEILKADNGVLRKENESLKAELQRVTGLTSIGGGIPGRMTNGQDKRDFASLSTAEMRKRLLSAKPVPGMPWL